ncbi:rhomboid family intramembrane serine protease [Alkalibacter mobilis]|uniref:rhomboid family intramembrane serine protease n=1 Tax=Alkalibacter mobilis TaxID=2787712 RepID=UPI00189ED8F2|nr:rhomboid family intramembrane serine protease [Alkalibacter mobilis]MBF7097719.1 rhomboid family intramembrane serine protease [Alkalibacter mobilis]
MNWLNDLERKIRKYAIHNLMYYIVVLTGLVFLLSMFFGGNFVNRLYFSPELIMRGEFWRVITFIFIPPSNSIIWIIFALYFYYMIGRTLEQQWGTARFNLYYAFGVLGTVVASLLTGNIGTPTYLNLSLFMAFAHLFPDFQVLLFLIIPVKMKYLAYLNWFFFGYSILVGTPSQRVAAIVALANFFIFFYSDFTRKMRIRNNSKDTRSNFNKQIREFKKRK